MSKFRTSLGDWFLRIDVNACRRVRDHAAYDLLESIGTGDIVELGEDLPTLSSVVWELVEPTARRRSITQAQFFDSITGDAITSMADAFANALAEFMPEPKPPEPGQSDASPDASAAAVEPSTPEADTDTDKAPPEPLSMVLCKLAARIPIEPGPYTLRELLKMAEAASSDRWDHTAAQLYLHSAIHRNPRKAATPYHRFHPFTFKSASASRGMSIASLHSWKDHFPNNKVVTLTIVPEPTNDPPNAIEKTQ